MIYRDRVSYEAAMVEFRSARAAHHAQLNVWNARIDKFGHSAVDRVVTSAAWIALFIGASMVVAAGAVAESWGWLFLWFIVFGIYSNASEWMRESRKKRFIASHPAPLFTREEPTYRAGGDTPPPRQESTPPPRRATSSSLGFGEALHILGIASLSRGSLNRAAIKEAYRDRIREYHPDKVAHVGPELRQLAETKSKQINAAYETLLDHFKE